jgi:superfamily I DNA/RNA helicase
VYKRQFQVEGFKHAVPRDVDSAFEVVRPQEGQEIKALVEVLKKLLERYTPEQIRILSPYGKTALAGTVFTREPENADERWLKAQLRHPNTQGKIRWRSIGKFKGLESDVVVITDINNKSKEWSESKGLWLEELLYVGMTRAKFHLVLMIGDGLFAGKG